MKLAGLFTAMRRILAIPDYAAYCAHVPQAHPGSPMPPDRSYFDV